MQLGHHEKSIIASIPVGIIVSLCFIYLLHSGGFVAVQFGAITLSPLLGSIVGVFLITSSIVSGGSYIGRALDTLFATNVDNKIEGWATILGIMIGFAVSVMLLISGFIVPFMGSIPLLPELTFIVVMLGACGGLCARVGRVLDRIEKPEVQSITPKVNVDFALTPSSKDFAPAACAKKQEPKNDNQYGVFDTVVTNHLRR